MAVKVFCNRRTFQLEAPDGDKMKLLPLGFSEVPEKFTGDITFVVGVKSGDIQVFETTKQGDQIEKAARTKKPAKEGTGKLTPEDTGEPGPKVNGEKNTPEDTGEKTDKGDAE